MKFRLQTHSNVYILEASFDFEARTSTPWPIKVRVQASVSEPEGGPETVDFASCKAVGEPELEEGVREALDSFWHGILPEGGAKPEHEEHVLADGRRLKPEMVELLPVHVYLPDDVASALDLVRSALLGSCQNAIGLLNWRSGRNGVFAPARPVHFLEWSNDGEPWRTLRSGGRTIAGVDPLLSRYGDEVTSYVAAEFGNGASPPLAHDLLAEAWELRLSNQRSALVLAVAAVEVGCKDVIRKLLPDAEWLVDRAPTPPVFDIVRSYLPYLPSAGRYAESPLVPPKRLRQRLHEAVEKRNRTAHVGEYDLGQDELETMLTALWDLLRIFDFYVGHEWSFDLLSNATRRELDQEAEGA